MIDGVWGLPTTGKLFFIFFTSGGGVLGKYFSRTSNIPEHPMVKKSHGKSKRTSMKDKYKM